MSRAQLVTQFWAEPGLEAKGRNSRRRRELLFSRLTRALSRCVWRLYLRDGGGDEVLVLLLLPWAVAKPSLDDFQK
jgi:hypothetical protein